MIQDDCGFATAYSVQESADPFESPNFRVAAELPDSRTQILSVDVDGDAWTIELAPMRDYPRRAVSRIVPTSDRHVFCAVVGGSAFIVDVRSPASAFCVDTDGAVTGIGCANAQGLVLLATDWEVFAVKGSALAWRSGRIAIEGIRLDEVDETRLAGVVDEDSDEPRNFMIDLVSGRVTGGSTGQ